MPDLTTKQRKRLPKGRFGLLGQRKYPIPDESHARNALARASEFASPSERGEIERNVHRLYPGIRIGGK